MPRIARLELSWTKDDDSGERWTCNYDLVLPLGEVDCRGTFDQKAQKRPKAHYRVWLDKDNCKRIPLGRTGSSGKARHTQLWPDGHMNTPFRDGVHIGWDAEQLGLRKFVRCGEDIREIVADEAKAIA